jgi:hypothetical protein
VAAYLFPFGLWVFYYRSGFYFAHRNISASGTDRDRALPLASWLRDEPLTMTLGLTGLFLLLVIRRLTAPLTPRSRSVSKRELYLNRLLFDRDIRDGKAWITLKPVTSLKSKKEGKD